MRKIYTLLLTLTVSTLSFGQVFYSENMGSPAANPSVATYTGWQNTSPITYTGTASARTSAASSGYTGATGSGNVFFSAAGAQTLQIGGLNTSAYVTADIQLSFGYLTTTTTAQMVVETSIDGTNWTPVTFTNNANTSWNLVTIPGGQIPSSTTLSLRFTAATSGGGMRIDDIKLANVSASCTFAFGTGTAVCDATTVAMDTYTATIAFTGAGNATYVVNATSGTVGGDNPTTTAAGNIIITGVTEGTNISVTVTGGTCNTSFPVTAPACEPINTLPYSEPFNYTAGTALGSTQMWTTDNSGDDIVAATGSLSYTGITATGNSITFSGTGAEARTPFTATTSGTLYASFIANITDISNVVNDLTDVAYFALFTDSGTGSTVARIWHRKNGTQSQFGVSTTAATSSIVWSPNLYNTGTTQYLVLGYDFATQMVTLTENPTIGGSASPSASATVTTSISTIGGFMFRQDSSNTTPTINIDELRIDTTPNFTLSNASFNAISGLNVYPNPANDFLHITSTANAVKTVAIYDIVGKQVLNTTTSNEVINVSNLNAGIYLVKITEEGKTATRKLVIK